MTTIEAMKQAFSEEVEAMRSGHCMPYHKLALVVALITCLFFCIFLQHQIAFDGRIAIIDLDNSRYSRELAQKLDASAYIEVTDIFYNAVPVSSLLMEDRNMGVLYIPKDFEKNLLNGQRSMKLGYYADYTNSAQNGVALSTLNEIIGEEGANISIPKVAAMGKMSADAAAIAVSPMSVGSRRLTDPVYSSTNGFVVAITLAFSSIYLGISSLMIVGRIRVSGQMERCLRMGYASWIARVLPYALIYATALTVACCLLINFGQMRFAGSWPFFLLTLFTTGVCIGLLSLFFSWNSEDPGAGTAYMILFVPPGFILGGATMAIPFFTDWVKYVSHVWPLVWEFRFVRDIAQRGEYQAGVVAHYGWYLLYTVVLALLVYWRYYKSMKLLSGPRTTDINELHFER